ncbi:hypothetical protein [Sediminicoccus sp. KRV36]|uniref:hypothetical protein n=1 Tax=Sediminicoccus sp. KRV36 TaxID=3133721 RepID=UPI00200CA46E|nr:hypothetical protein [Sediminicoccus rosea]UPY35862.1 hypothetical protein LHU95_16755 [Sediminicoccus rosea]
MTLRTIGMVALGVGIVAFSASAGPTSGPRFPGPAPVPGLELVFWRAGGVTAGGTAWHAGGAGGARWGGAYHYGGGYHGYVGGYAARPYPGAMWRSPVAVAPFYHPAAGAFVAGAMVGAAASAGTAANSGANYGQPTTVINNYY